MWKPTDKYNHGIWKTVVSTIGEHSSVLEIVYSIDRTKFITLLRILKQWEKDYWTYFQLVGNIVADLERDLYGNVILVQTLYIRFIFSLSKQVELSVYQFQYVCNFGFCYFMLPSLLVLVSWYFFFLLMLSICIFFILIFSSFA